MGAEAHGIRLTSSGKTVAYSGDTSWCNNLKPLSKGADLFITECTFKTADFDGHLCLEELQTKTNLLEARNVALTHYGEDVANTVIPPPFRLLKDGEIINL